MQATATHEDWMVDLVDSLSVPDQFVCPISHDIMLDPVSAADGHTYGRRGIAAWLSTHNTSPLTGEVLEDKGCTSLVLNALDQLRWLFNWRGAERECNPVMFAYAVVSVADDEGASAKSVVSATLFLRALDDDPCAGNHTNHGLPDTTSEVR